MSRLPILPGHLISLLLTRWAVGLPGSPTGCSTSSPAAMGSTWCHRNQALSLESALAGVWEHIYFGNSEMFAVFQQPGQYQYFTTLKTKSVRICSVAIRILVLLLLPYWFSFVKSAIFCTKSWWRKKKNTLDFLSGSDTTSLPCHK